MSETAAPAAPAAATEAPAEPPFTTDVLQSCTARFTRQAWDLYESWKSDLSRIQTALVRARLTARTDAGSESLAQQLRDAGVAELTRQGKDLHFTATFAQIQKVIKLPESFKLDAVKI